MQDAWLALMIAVVARVGHILISFPCERERVSFCQKTRGLFKVGFKDRLGQVEVA